MLPENLAQATLPLGNWYDIFTYWQTWVSVVLLLAAGVAGWKIWKVK